jgi:hypothetical protein
MHSCNPPIVVSLKTSLLISPFSHTGRGGSVPRYTDYLVGRQGESQWEFEFKLKLKSKAGLAAIFAAI